MKILIEHICWEKKKKENELVNRENGMSLVVICMFPIKRISHIRCWYNCFSGFVISSLVLFSNFIFSLNHLILGCIRFVRERERSSGGGHTEGSFTEALPTLAMMVQLLHKVRFSIITYGRPLKNWVETQQPSSSQEIQNK